MSRIARRVLDNSHYHIMCRGNNKFIIFHEVQDYLYFLKLLVKYKNKYLIKIYNFVLMTNHFHFLLFCQKSKFLSQFVKGLNVSYVGYYRKKYSGIGHFMQDRFKSIIVEDGQYLMECARYIEYNPIKAKMVKDLADYEWSSYKYYTEKRFEDVVDENPFYPELFKNAKDKNIEYKNYIMKGQDEKRSESRIFRVGVYGSKEFRDKLKEKGIDGKWSHSGRPKGKKDS